MRNLILLRPAATKPTRKIQGYRGFTLIELLITISIAAILLAVAAPSFRDLIAGQRIKTASYDVLSVLTYARSEAIKRNGPVIVAPLTSGWQNGWKVTFGGGNPLKQQDAFSGLAITGPASIIYSSDGRIASSQSFQISSSVNTGLTARCISIDLSGLPYSKIGNCS